MDTTSFSYCRSRCRGQIKFGLFGLALGIVSAASFIAIIKYDVVFTDGTTTTIAKFVLPFVFLFGMLLMFLGFRDALFPAKSTLADSIRSQLKYADEATSVDELFGTVDNDIEKNGKWFGNLAIGKEWIFSDTVMNIDRVRAAFYKIEREFNNNRTTVTFILTLIDDKRQDQNFYMKSEDAMMTAYQTICVMVPEIYTGPRKKFIKMSDTDYNTFEAEFKEKQQNREAQKRDQAQNPQDMVLQSPDGNVTSRVNDSTLMQALQELKDEGSCFRLQSTRNLNNKFGRLLHIDCTKKENHYYLLCTFENNSGPSKAFRMLVPERDALELLSQFTLYKRIPDVSSWEKIDLEMVSQASSSEQFDIKLTIWNDGGKNSFDNFTREDVELAIEDVLAEENNAIQVQCGWIYYYISTKDMEHSMFEINASILEGAELKCYATKCDGEQAKRWILAFYDRLIMIVHSEAGGTSESLDCIYPHYTLPDIKQWKDITKKFKK